MRENPSTHWNRLVKKIKPTRAQSRSTESNFPLVLIIREFSLENVRRKLLSRCVMYRNLGINLCLASVVSLILGYSILALGFILLGSGITLFSEIWKRYLPKSCNTEQVGLTSNESDSTNISDVPSPVMLPHLSLEQRQASVPFVPGVTPFEIEEFFNSNPSPTNRY